MGESGPYSERSAINMQMAQAALANNLVFTHDAFSFCASDSLVGMLTAYGDRRILCQDINGTPRMTCASRLLVAAMATRDTALAVYDNDCKQAIQAARQWEET